MTTTIRKNPLTAHFSDAGFSPGSDARIAKHAGAEKNAQARLLKRAMLPPVSEVRPDVELPDDFVATGVAKLELLLKMGQFDAMKEAIDRLALEHLLQQDAAARPKLTGGALLACHVTELGLPLRTSNLIEEAGGFTVGALLGCFPEKFVDLPNCGEKTVREIAKAMVDVGAMTTEDAAAAVEEWDRRTGGKKRAEA